MGLKIILQVVLALLVVITAFLDYFFDDRKGMPFKSARLVLIVIAVVAMGFGIKGVIDDERDKQAENHKRQEESQRLLARIAELEKQAQETQKSLIGDGFCYVTLQHDAVNKNLFLSIVNDGNHPMYDVTFRIWIPDEFPKGDSFNSDTKNLNPKEAAFNLTRFPLPTGDSKTYRVNIFARNGKFIQDIKVRRVGDVWARAYKLYSSKEGSKDKLLYKFADSGYPKDGDDDILKD